MGYIYKIYNDINTKIYIGLTTLSNPIDRWTKHLTEYQTAIQYSKRPLYEAMRKYGVDKFHFEVIEEVEDSVLSEREKYWIEQFKTYIGFESSNGYNATLGGDGLKKNFFSLDKEKEICNLFEQGHSCRAISNLYGHTETTISNLLKEKGYVFNNQKGNLVGQFDKNDILINTFQSAKSAAESLGKKGKGGHITEVCNSKRKTAYGFIWNYI